MAASSSTTTPNTVTLAEVNAHNNRNDCWIILHNKVYNVTKFLRDHPGGERAILDYAGRDATEAFENVGHSDHAKKLLVEMLVGELPEGERGASAAEKKKMAEAEAHRKTVAALPTKTAAEVAAMDGVNSEVLAENNGEKTMWIIIRNLVYDVSKFYKMHPGGAKVIKDLGGKDATFEFEKVGHTNNAMSLLSRYLIAKVAKEDEKDYEKLAAAQGDQMKQYTLAEVSKHCKEGDYWFVIDNRVYNVTEFIGAHPGGREPLTHNAGLDATDAFAEVGHSAGAKNKLKGLQIGVLVEADRRTAKPAVCKSTSYSDVTADSLRKAEKYHDGGKFPFLTTALILILLVFSMGGVALMIMADRSQQQEQQGSGRGDL